MTYEILGSKKTLKLSKDSLDGEKNRLGIIQINKIYYISNQEAVELCEISHIT